MLSISANNPYYINRLNPTSLSTNHYVYLSGFEGSVDIINEQWIFDFQLYVNGNFNVPTNSLYVNLTTPFAEKIQIPIIHCPDPVSWPKYVEDNGRNLYIFNAIIPTSGTEYFNNKYINQRININLDFHVEPENINKADIPEADRSAFITEFDAISASTNVSYTNYHEGKDQGSGNIIDQYKVVNDNCSVINPRQFGWALNNNCLDLKTPLCSLVDIDLKNNFIVRGYQVEFNYALETGGSKSLKYKDDSPKYCTDKFHLDLPFATYFDEEKKEVVQTEGENKGFFIPKNSYGYYTLTLLLATENTWVTLKLTKAFNFILDSSYETKLKVRQYPMDTLKNCTRMVI